MHRGVAKVLSMIPIRNRERYPVPMGRMGQAIFLFYDAVTVIMRRCYTLGSRRRAGGIAIYGEKEQVRYVLDIIRGMTTPQALYICGCSESTPP